MRVDVKRTEDTEFIKEVVMSVWDSGCEDGANKETWEPDPNDLWLEIIVDGRRVGAYMLHFWNRSTMELHAQIFPHERKRFTFDVSKAVHRWLLENCRPHIQKFVAFIPSKYPNVAKYAVGSGWVQEGQIEGAWFKDGVAHDLYVMGCTRDRMEAWV